MKVLRDHFENKPTILIDDWVINGCATFKMDQAQEVLDEYNVPMDIWQQVLYNYTGVSTPEEIASFLDDKDYRVRKAIAHAGYHLDILINDPDSRVRREVAKQGYGLDILVNDPEYWVREWAKNILMHVE